jgi:hypothetical protein
MERQSNIPADESAASKNEDGPLKAPYLFF